MKHNTKVGLPPAVRLCWYLRSLAPVIQLSFPENWMYEVRPSEQAGLVLRFLPSLLPRRHGDCLRNQMSQTLIQLR